MDRSRSSRLRTRRLRALVTLLVVLTVAWVCPCAAESLKSKVKMQRSNPVLPVLIDGESVNLILTTDVDGILICSDMTTGATTSPKIDFDYARRLLRFQLQGMIQDFAAREIRVPALQFSGMMPLGHFHLKKQWLSPASIEYFLQSSNASGFIGVGLAFRPMYSRFWTMIDDDDSAVGSSQQYAYRGMVVNSTSKLADLTVRGGGSTVATAADPSAGDDEMDEDTDGDLVNGYMSSAASGKLVWSEPLAPVEDREDAANSQGISFPVHRALFRCAPSLADQAESASASSSSSLLSNHEAHLVEIFGEFSGNWDVAIDFNVPCLVLPQQFFDSLAGWLGLRYNDELKLAEISGAAPLPDLVFSLSLDGPQLTIPLQKLVLPELQVTTSPASNSSRNESNPKASNTLQRVCIQRSGSIVQNGAAVFSPLDQDAGSVQRYRLHGSLSLPLFNMFQAPIVFGAMVLDNFEQVVIDGTAKRTGIQNARDSSSSNSNAPSPRSSESSAAFATCLRPAQCIGQQQYLHRLNACRDPDCSLYFFQSLDASTKQCVIDASWTTTIAIVMTLCLAVEATFAISMKRIVLKTRQASSFAN